MTDLTAMLGVSTGRFVVVDGDGNWLGRWDNYGDAEAHKGEHQAMDPEADLEVYDLSETPC